MLHLRAIITEITKHDQESKIITCGCLTNLDVKHSVQAIPQFLVTSPYHTESLIVDRYIPTPN